MIEIKQLKINESMMDWLVLWGVTQAVGFVFKPILEDLAKDAAKDYVKDFFKSCLSNVLRFPKKEPIQIATGKAITEFLKLIQQELEDADLDNITILQYRYSLEKFIKNKTVADILGSAFQTDYIDTQTLKQIWEYLQLKTLPDEFNWEKLTKRYLKKVKAIIQETSELREILDSQNLEKMAAVVPVQPDFDLLKHQEGIRERYGNLNLESLDTTGCAYNALKLWNIFVPQNVRECQEYLPQVYELPKDYFRQLKERGELDDEISLDDLEQRRQLYSQQSIQSVLEIVQNPDINYLVILGDPGSGKSTLLQYLALTWAQLPPKELPDYPIPLLIELRTYNREKQEKQCKSILEFFHEGNVICQLPQQELDSRLRQGNVLVMFDGLDEVFDPAQREEVITDIHRFTNDYPKIRAIVTSRVIGYKAQRLRDAEFRHFMLQDLEDEQIEYFIQNWHNLTFNDEADKIRKRDRLKQAVANSSAIRELAGNPLLVTMMAILNRNQELPRDRAELYNQASRVLLHQWDIERALLDEKIDPVTVDYRDKQEMLRRVAFFMQGNAQGLAGNLISREDLERILTEYLREIVRDARTLARALIEQLRSRNFILCYVGGDFYAFVHRTFLEYFCAWEFIWQFEKARSLTEEDLVQVYVDHWREEAWHEVLTLICAMLDITFTKPVIEFLVSLEVDKSNFLEPIQWRLNEVRNCLKQEGLMNLILAAKCLHDIQNRSAVAELDIKLLKKIQKQVELEHFHTHIEPQNYSFTFEAASLVMNVIAMTWQGNTQVLSWIKDTLLDLRQSYIPACAVSVIAKGWKDNSDTWPTLYLIVDSPHDSTPAMQSAAVRAIACYYKNDQNTLPILKRISQNTEEKSLQQAALIELSAGWKEDHEVLLLLKQYAQDENCFFGVRSEAITALAKGWSDEPWIFNFLCDRAINDPFIRKHESNRNPRIRALKAILENYPNHPQTLPLLRDRAENDPDEQLREWAKDQLEKFDDD